MEIWNSTSIAVDVIKDTYGSDVAHTLDALSVLVPAPREEEVARANIAAMHTHKCMWEMSMYQVVSNMTRGGGTDGDMDRPDMGSYSAVSTDPLMSLAFSISHQDMSRGDVNDVPSTAFVALDTSSDTESPGKSMSDEDEKLGTMVKHWMSNKTCIEERPSYDVNDEGKDGPGLGGILDPNANGDEWQEPWHDGGATDNTGGSDMPAVEIFVMEPLWYNESNTDNMSGYNMGIADNMSGGLHTGWKADMGGDDTYVPNRGHDRGHATMMNDTEGEVATDDNDHDSCEDVMCQEGDGGCPDVWSVFLESTRSDGSDKDEKIDEIVRHWMSHKTCIAERPPHDADDEGESDPGVGEVSPPESGVSWVITWSYAHDDEWRG